MIDTLTRLATLTTKDRRGLLPCRCGAKATLDDPRIVCLACGNDFLFPIFTSRELKKRSWNVQECDAALLALVQDAAAEIERLKDAAASWHYFEPMIKRLLSIDDAVINRLGLTVGDSIVDGIAAYLESLSPKDAKEHCEQAPNAQEVT